MQPKQFKIYRDFCIKNKLNINDSPYWSENEKLRLQAYIMNYKKLGKVQYNADVLKFILPTRTIESVKKITYQYSEINFNEITPEQDSAIIAKYENKNKNDIEKILAESEIKELFEAIHFMKSQSSKPSINQFRWNKSNKDALKNLLKICAEQSGAKIVYTKLAKLVKKDKILSEIPEEKLKYKLYYLLTTDEDCQSYNIEYDKTK